jgi:mannosyltransferase OCH1-like enzyme
VIPKKLHFIWLQGYSELPPDRRHFVDSWAHYHSDWSIKVWSYEDLPQLKNEWVLESDDLTLQSDVARFELVYQEGGVYLDTDIECLQSLNNLTMFVGDYDAFISKRSRLCLATSSFGAGWHHPWLKELLDEIGNAKDELLAGPAQIRGPLERVTRRYPKITRFHRSFLESPCCEGNAIGTHYRLGDWREEYEKLRASRRQAE